MQDNRKYLAQVHLEKRLAPLPESVMLVKNAIQGVMGNKECDLSRLGREPIHQRLANWRSGPQDTLEFTKRYGALDWDGELVGQRNIPGTKFKFLDFEWQQRQNQIREVWEKGPEARVEWWTLSLLGHFPVAKEKDRISRQFEPCDPKLDDEDEEILQGPETIWELTPKGPIAVVTALTTWQYICLLMTFEKLSRFRKCENPECPAPYFIATRKDRIFCSDDCSHRIAANRWWSRHGNEWRRARRNLGKKR